MQLELLSPSLELRLGIATFPPPARTERRRIEQAAVAVLLCALLSCPTAPKRAYREDGSPYLPDYPDYSLSISHAEGGAAVLLAPASHLAGIDLERYREQLIHVAPRYLHPSEWAMLHSHAPYTEEILRTLLWTAKEACFKIAHPPSGSLLSYQTSAIDSAVQTLRLGSSELNHTLTLHYLLRPPFVLSFGIVPRSELP